MVRRIFEIACCLGGLWLTGTAFAQLPKLPPVSPPPPFLGPKSTAKTEAPAAPDVAALAEKLSSKDDATSYAAADGLTALGPQAEPAVPALTKALGSANPELRWRAARALAAIGPKSAPAAPNLATRLEDGTPTVRANAANALGAIGPAAKEHAEKLSKVVTDPDPMVRRAAIQALSRLELDRDVALALFVKTLEDADHSVVLPALHSLAERGEKAVPLLREALKNEKSRYWACVALADIGPAAKDAVPDLAKLTTSENAEIRLQTAVALGQIGSGAASAAPALGNLLNDPEVGVRYGAAFALGSIGSPVADEALKKNLSGSDAQLKMISGWALAKIHPTDSAMMEQAVKLALNTVRHGDESAQKIALRAWFDLNPPKEMTGPLVAETLDTLPPEKMEGLMEALAAFGPKAVPRVASALENPKLKHRAAEILARMGADAQAAVPNLMQAMKTGDPEFQRECQFALANIGPGAAAAVPQLTEALGHANEEVRGSACYALGRIGPEARSATPALLKMLKDEEGFLKIASVWALVRIDGVNPRIGRLAVPLLIRGLQNDRELVRAEAARMLGEMGPQAEAALADLRRMSTADSSSLVRDIALESIGKIAK